MLPSDMVGNKKPYDRHKHGEGLNGFFGEVLGKTIDRESTTEEGKHCKKARENMIDFTTYTFPQYITDPFHDHVAEALTKVSYPPHHKDYDPTYQYLMLFAPPQHGKSELVSTRLPPFFLANNPDLPVGMVSYAATLAERNSRNARAVLQDPKFNQVFPNLKGQFDNWRVHEWHTHDVGTGEPAGGYALAVGVGGAITGHGFGLIVIDDPIESWAHAQSERIRETTWGWWLGTLKTRIWEGGKIILMMTRWHKDDLAGRILEEEGTIEEGGRWRVLSYPALSMRPTTPEQEEQGTEKIIPDLLERGLEEPLAPSRFSVEYLKDHQKTLSRLVWMAEYQQVPTDPEGTFFKVGRINIEEAVPFEVCDLLEGLPVNVKKGVRYWDLAATEQSAEARDPDYTSGTLMAEGPRRFWILDEVRGQLDPEQVFDLVKMTAKLDGKAVKIRIEQEPGAAGKSLIASYQKALAGYDVDGAPASGDKTVKAQGFATQVNIGNVAMLKGVWNKPMIAEMAGFPNIRHDDQVDSGAGAFNQIVSEESRWVDIKFLAV